MTSEVHCWTLYTGTSVHLSPSQPVFLNVQFNIIIAFTPKFPKMWIVCETGWMIILVTTFHFQSSETTRNVFILMQPLHKVSFNNVLYPNWKPKSTKYECYIGLHRELLSMSVL